MLVYCPKEYLIKLEQWFLDNVKPEYNIRKIADRNEGVKCSPEKRDRLLEARGEPIYQLSFSFEIVNKFRSCKEAERVIGSSNISGCVNTNCTKSASGYLWIYVKDYERFKNTTGLKTYISNKGGAPRGVTQCDKSGNVLKEWNSIKEAAQELNYVISGISRAVCGTRNTYKGYIWKLSNNKTNIYEHIE